MRFLTFHVLLLLLVLIHFLPTATAIDYGTDVSYPMHYPRVTNHPNERDLLGPDKQALYRHHLKGCFDYYDGPTCRQVENDRIGMNLRQPQSMVNYTRNGYVKIRAPQEVWELVQAFWKNNKDQAVREDWPTGSVYVNHWEARVDMVSVENHTLEGGGNILKNAIWNAARRTLSDWTGHTLADCSLYGVRIYHEGSILAPHVDRLPLVASAILNVDQDLDEPWPLEVIGHDQRAKNITMEPGDLVLYESHSIIHGRPFPLKGRFMANIFIHFEPVAPLDDPHPQFTGDLPPYILPNSPEVPHWKGQFPNGWHAVQTPALTKGTTEAHQIVIKQDLDDLKYILDLHPSYANAQDESGWTPLHEATRTLRLDLVQALVEGGADVHAKTKAGESALLLAAYYVETTENEYQTHPYQHPMVQYLAGLGAKAEGNINVVHQIVVKQDLEELKAILNLHPSFVNVQDELGWTPLHEATRTLRLDLVQALEVAGADIHAKTKAGESVLLLAVYYVETTENDYQRQPHQHPMVQYLAGLGAKIERYGMTQEL